MLKSIIKGFSLLELVVVLAVMGTLAAVAVPAFSAVTGNSSDGALLSSAEGIAKAANSAASSATDEPGRGAVIGDSAATLLGNDEASVAGNVITVFGQKDRCIKIAIVGSASAATFKAGEVGSSTGTGSTATCAAVAPTS